MTFKEGARVLVVGLGSSGEAAARALHDAGAAPVVIDSSDTPTCAGSKAELEEAGIEVRLGVVVPEDLDTFEMVVVSPGVPDRAPVLVQARALGTRVISELELGYLLIPDATIVAITGTNGKTTTTELTAAMLDGGERRAIPCGNIGTPLVSLTGKTSAGDVLVCEVSSFQLQNIESFHPGVAVLLNLAPDHFDWHRDMGEYGRAKARIIEHMGPDDFLVYNADDEFCSRLASEAPGKAVGFSRRGARVSMRLEDERIFTSEPFEEGPLINIEDIALVGAHNLDNIMAAAACALALGKDRRQVREAASAFRGLEHRCEPAGSFRGVEFFNDSKATNPHASLQAVASFDRPFVVIAGGRNKGLEFSDLARVFCARMEEGTLAGLVLIGESAGQISETVLDVCGPQARDRVVGAADMDDSVRKAYEMTPQGGAVLFSPACASFDMFNDYKDRGEAFKSAVRKLAGGSGSGSVE